MAESTVAESPADAVENQRVRRGHHAIEHWAGTLADVREVFAVAERALVARHHGPPDAEIRVIYDDGGHQDVERIASLSEEVVAIAEVEGIEYNTRWRHATDDWVSVVFDSNEGVQMTVHSLDAVWKAGLIAALSDSAQANALPTNSGTLRPLRWWEWGGLILGVGLVTLEVLITPRDVALPLVVVTVLAFSFALESLRDIRLDNPRFLLVPEGHDAEAAGSKRARGITVRIRDWLLERPGVALLLTVLLGVLTNKISDLIDGLM